MSSMTDVIYDMDVAIDVKSFLMSNLDNLSFKDIALKAKILDADNNVLLRIGRVINSHTIVSVDIIDDTFFKENLFINDGNKN